MAVGTMILVLDRLHGAALAVRLMTIAALQGLLVGILFRKIRLLAAQRFQIQLQMVLVRKAQVCFVLLAWTRRSEVRMIVEAGDCLVKGGWVAGHKMLLEARMTGRAMAIGNMGCESILALMLTVAAGAGGLLRLRLVMDGAKMTAVARLIGNAVVLPAAQTHQRLPGLLVPVGALHVKACVCRRDRTGLMNKVQPFAQDRCRADQRCQGRDAEGEPKPRGFQRAWPTKVIELIPAGKVARIVAAAFFFEVFLLSFEHDAVHQAPP